VDRPSKLRGRRARAVALALALALSALLVACGGNTPVGRAPAAVVEGREIAHADLVALVEAQERYLERLVERPELGAESAQAALDALPGTAVDGYAMDAVRPILEVMIRQEMLLARIEAEGEEITAADREAARSQLEAEAGQEVLGLMDPVLVDLLVDIQAAESAIERVATEASEVDVEARKRELFEEIAPQRPLCISVIVTETLDDMAAAQARLDEGEEFAAVASEVSVDPASAAAGGFAGCAAPEQALELTGVDLSTASAGDIIGPEARNEVQVLFRVDSTTGPTFEQLDAELTRQVEAEQQNSVGTYLRDLQADAEVTVDPRFGRWDADTFTVVAPTT
jgi:parvulin-like peptidyl-prolyl isomerase